MNLLIVAPEGAPAHLHRHYADGRRVSYERYRDLICAMQSKGRQLNSFLTSSRKTRTGIVHDQRSCI